MSEVKMHTMGTPDEKDRTDQILLHYGIYDEVMQEARESGVDFMIGKTASIRELTADMAGFGCERSQRVIIDYNKDYEHFIVRRILKNVEN